MKITVIEATAEDLRASKSLADVMVDALRNVFSGIRDTEVLKAKGTNGEEIILEGSKHEED